MTGGDERGDPEDDLDFISQEGPHIPVIGASFGFSGLRGSPTPVFVPKQSTPLQEEGRGDIPAAALWAMKYQRHARLFSRADMEIRERYGNGDDTVYVMDDGRKRCVISRSVGTGPDGTTYWLVAHITVVSYEQLVDDASRCHGIFADAHDFALCAVYQGDESTPESGAGVSNVAVVLAFDSVDEVPLDYLPPHPAIVFSQSPGDAD